MMPEDRIILIHRCRSDLIQTLTASCERGLSKIGKPQSGFYLLIRKYLKSELGSSRADLYGKNRIVCMSENLFRFCCILVLFKKSYKNPKSLSRKFSQADGSARFFLPGFPE